MMATRSAALARKWAEKFFTEHPSPDAAWFIREGLIPMLAEYIAAAVREALEMAEKEARNLLHCKGAKSRSLHGMLCHSRIGDAIAALREANEK